MPELGDGLVYTCYVDFGDAKYGVLYFDKPKSLCSVRKRFYSDYFCVYLPINKPRRFCTEASKLDSDRVYIEGNCKYLS